jgi:hypothetical protein
MRLSIKNLAFLPLISASRLTKRETADPVIHDIQSAVEYYDVPSEIANHGCHCRILEGFENYGTPIDNRDDLCRSWKSARTCVSLLGGECHGVEDTSYDVSNGCGALSGCQKALCEIDFSFQSSISKEQTSLVSNAYCERNQVSTKDSCCGNSPSSYRQFDSEEYSCDAGSQTLARITDGCYYQDPLPEFIKVGLQEGTWAETTNCDFIHVGRNQCYPADPHNGGANTCLRYCQQQGTDLAAPMSAQQQTAYFDIYDQYFRPQQSFPVAWYAINEADHSDIWNELNWCSVQPWSRASAPHGYCAIAVGFRPEYVTAKCVQKVPCHYVGFPMCVYDPNAPSMDRMIGDYDYEYNAEENIWTEEDMELWKNP